MKNSNSQSDIKGRTLPPTLSQICNGYLSETKLNTRNIGEPAPSQASKDANFLSFKSCTNNNMTQSIKLASNNKPLIMSKQYMQSFSKKSYASRLARHSRSSIQKKEISDSNLQFEDMEESCIVLDESQSQQENVQSINNCAHDNI